MTDSFFGFNTALDPALLRPETLGDGELGGGIEDGDLDSRLRQFTLTAGDDIEIYDYDDLGDRLEETNDDLNDETFGDDPVAAEKDFDFAGSTARMVPTLESEMARNRQEDKDLSKSRANRPELHLQQQRQQKQFEQSNQISTTQRRPSYASLWDDANGKQPESSIWSTFSPFQSTFGPDALSPSYAPSSFGSRGLGDAPPRTAAQKQGFESPTGSPLPRRAMTVEEIEAEMLRRNTVGVEGGRVGGTKMMSVQEIEAAMRSNRKGGVPVNIGGHEQLERPYDTELERRKEERMREMAESAKYNNLMTQYDKDLIARIQISQLVTDDPYKDDFYYQVYTAIRSRLGLPPTGGPPLNHMGRPEVDTKGNRTGGKGRAEGGMLRMQQQVQRIVHNNQQRKPKSTQLSLEGVLGKTTSSSSRNPRVLLQVKPKTSNDEVKPGDSKDKDKNDTREEKSAAPVPKIGAKPRTMGNHRRVLRSIENVYNGVLALEQLRRVQPPAPRPDAPEDVLDGFRRWNRDYASFVKDVWKELKITEPIGTSYPHPFISFICTAKGKKVIPRVLRHSLPEQILALLSLLIANLESVDAVAQAVYGPIGAITNAAQESENIFMNTIIPPAMAFVAESPLGIVVGLLTLFLENNNVAWAARGKIGLVFLTMLLSRAEILKQGGGALQGLPPPTEDELARCAQMYLRTFNSLQGHFAHIFPPPAAKVDDVYVWQFLAAIAVGASMEQQHILVTEVRERVLEAVVLSQSGRLSAEKASAKISNCNLFLHALGLDASQVVV